MDDGEKRDAPDIPAPDDAASGTPAAAGAAHPDERAPGRRPGRVRRILVRGVVALVVLFALIQLVPYGRDHTNPPVAAEPSWDSPRTRELAVKACFDCHSNETKWPWYTNVAPASWLVQKDVDEGREVLNFSEWGRPQEEAGDAAEVIEEGEMPPRQYTIIHGNLSADEKAALAAGMRRTLAASGVTPGRGGGDGD